MAKPHPFDALIEHAVQIFVGLFSAKRPVAGRVSARAKVASAKPAKASSAKVGAPAKAAAAKSAKASSAKVGARAKAASAKSAKASSAKVGAPAKRKRSSWLKGKTLDMNCRVPDCKNKSGGPRHGFMCVEHQKLPKEQQEAARYAYKAKGRVESGSRTSPT